MFEAQFIKKLKQTEAEKRCYLYKKNASLIFYLCHFRILPETIKKPKDSLNYEIKSFTDGLSQGNIGQNYK